MNPSFNLVEEPWIPCIRSNGNAIELGLRQTLKASHELREMAGESPLITAALHRLLLSVLHRVHGPPGYDVWNSLWRAGRFADPSLYGYLDRWRERFELFHPQHPFYQAADERVKPKSVASLVHDVASGNNATLFDHHTEITGITLSPAQAARVLVTAQAFGLAGLSGLSQKFTDGPCARGILFLIEGRNLFETIMLNLLRYEGERPLPRQADDQPAWEMDNPYKPDRRLPRGYLDYLTWQNRRILLFPEGNPAVVRQATVAPGLSLDPTVLDPMKCYRRDQKRGERVLRFTEERALWRDSETFLQLHSDSSQAPQAFSWVAQLMQENYLSSGEIRPTLALGMANYQAKVEFYRSERLSLPLIFLKEPGLVNLLGQNVLRPAELVGNQLYGATATLAKLALAPEADNSEAFQPKMEDVMQMMAPWGVKRRYWSGLEVPFRIILEKLPGDQVDALWQWQKTVRLAAWEALEGATKTVEASFSALKAVVQARDQLALGLAKVLPSVQ